MKSVIVALCAVGCVYAASVSEQTAQVVKSSYDISPEGNFQSVFETENGIASQSAGTLKSDGKGGQFLVVSGSNQHKSPEGEVLTLTYVADENGYQPQAAYLPTPPPTEALPPYVARALDWIANHPYKEATKP